MSDDSGSSSGGGGGRNMTEIKCSACGNKGKVPFTPTPGQPVYCRECFQKKRNTGGGGGGRGRGRGGPPPKKQRWARSEYWGYDPDKHAPSRPAK